MGGKLSLLWLEFDMLPIKTYSLQRDRVVEKRDRVIAAVVDAAEQLCQCGFTAGHIDSTASGFQCSSFQSSLVLFRSKLYGTASRTASEVIADINQWISSDVSIVVLGLILEIDPTCPVLISTFSDPECQLATSPPSGTSVTTSTEVPSGTSTTTSTEAIIAGVVVGIVIIAIAVVVVVIAVIIIRRRRSSWKLRHMNER